MKKIWLIIFTFISLFMCMNNVFASEVYCEADYELFTDSDSKQKCKKSLGAPMTEFNQKTCTNGRLIGEKCYDVKNPIIDGCEQGYVSFADKKGNKMCKKELNDSETSELIETFCKNNTSCVYLKEPNQGKMKCEKDYELYTDSNGNKKCKKSLGSPMTEFGKKSCTGGILMDDGKCYSIKDPLDEGNGCESGYKLYKDSNGKQKCQKNINESETLEIMTKVCEKSNSNCKYIKNIIKKTEQEDEEDPLGEVLIGCEVIPKTIRKWINNILNFVKYVALVLVIALGALDFMKAAGSGEGDAMKKAGQSFLKRMIAVVILFLLPLIVELILNLVNIYGVDPDNINCMK